MANSPIIYQGNNAKSLKPNLKFDEAIIKTGTFDAANNQVAAANVIGLDLSSFKGGKVVITIDIDATANRHSTFELDFTQLDSDFDMAQTFTKDGAGITFSITSGGLVQYQSENETGFVSSTMKFELKATNA
jgi:hypothetical protein